MMSSKNRAIFSFIAVFIIGVAVGVLFENLLLDKKHRNRQRHDPNKFLFEKFTNELSLSTAQQDTLQMLLDDIKEKHRVLGKKRREDYDRIRQEFETEFRKILTNEQATKYDEILREFEERMQKKRDKDHKDRDSDKEREQPKKDDL